MTARLIAQAGFAGVLALLLCAQPACKFHERNNCSHDKDCLSSEMCTDHFCVPKKDGSGGKGGGSADASDSDATTMGDASKSDSGTKKDAGGTVDAGPKPCAEGDRELCYDGDPNFLQTDDDPTKDTRICRGGVRRCEQTEDGWFYGGKCSGQVLPAANETCDGKDDDCDGKVDEEIAPESCTVDNAQGACAAGTTTCGEDGLSHCVADKKSEAETCDGSDNDCDGKTDEGTDEACYPEDKDGCTKDSAGNYTCVGTCQLGTKACKDGKLASACKDAVTPATDGCTSGGGSAADDDCDSKIDEDCVCTSGATQPCYTGPPGTLQGICRAGTQTCVNVGTGGTSEYRFSKCNGDVTPKQERCTNEGTDDDCNGTDDDVPDRGGTCFTSSSGLCGTGVNDCVGDNLTCVTPAETSETCDGRDEDCDNKVDEDFHRLDDEMNCGHCGNVCAAGKTCCGGRCVNAQNGASTDPDANANQHCGASCTICGSGSACCSGTCTDIATTNNCGGCGIKCVVLGLGATCSCATGVCKGTLNLCQAQP